MKLINQLLLKLAAAAFCMLLAVDAPTSASPDSGDLVRLWQSWTIGCGWCKLRIRLAVYAEHEYNRYRIWGVDVGFTGDAVSHEVGLYDATGSLFVSATVPTPTSQTIPGYIWVDLNTPQNLLAGDEYTIMGVGNGAPDYYNPTVSNGLVISPSISIGPESDIFYTPTTFGSLDASLSGSGERFEPFTPYQGADFIISTGQAPGNGTPEPGTFARLISGGIAASGFLRRRRA